MKNKSLSLGELRSVTGIKTNKLIKYLKSKKILPVIDNPFNKYYLLEDICSDEKGFIEFLNSIKINVDKDDFKDKLEERLKNIEENKKLKEERKVIEKERQEIINSFSKDFQERIYQQWFTESFKDREYILHIGDTGSGKTYHAVKDLMDSDGKRAYLAPLRLLAWEIYEKFNENGISCNLLTGEEKVVDKNADVYSSTIEMFNYSKFYESVVIDECFMMGDKIRGKSWLKAILLANAKRIHLILNKETENIIRSVLDFSNRKYTIKEYTRLVPLEVTNKTTSLNKIKNKTINIVFSKLSVLRYKSYFENLNKKVSVLYGDLPPEVKKQQMQQFIDGETDVCVSTDVIGMGLNLPCETVNFIETSKFDGEKVRTLNETEIKQISGRAGRYGYTNKGYITANDGYFLKNNITQALKSFIPLKETYFGIYDDYLDIIPGDKLSDKIKNFNESDFIPKKLKTLIIKEPVEKYLNLINQLIDSIQPLDVAWALITMPIRKNSKTYWEYIVKEIYYKRTFKTPYILFKKDVINNNIELETVETEVQNIDLFIYAYNNRILSNHIVENVDINIIKQRRDFCVNIILEYLLSKDNVLIKKCKSCDCEMDINSKYSICYECFTLNNYW